MSVLLARRAARPLNGCSASLSTLSSILSSTHLPRSRPRWFRLALHDLHTHTRWCQLHTPHHSNLHGLTSTYRRNHSPQQVCFSFSSFSSSSSSSTAPPAFSSPIADNPMDWPCKSSLSRPAWQAALAQHARREFLLVELAGNKVLPEDIAALLKEIGKLEAMSGGVQAVLHAVQEITDLDEMLAECKESGDKDMANEAENERKINLARLAAVEEEIVLASLPQDEDDDRNAILEVRAGTGGDEAALFTMDMYHMYEKFAKIRGWTFKLLEKSESEHGGYKSASAQLTGNDVFGTMKYEVGVHRVQRVPATETQGRIHTSTMSVAVMPEAEDLDVQLNVKRDLRIDIYRSGGKGGQSVNCTDSAVRLTHHATGLTVAMQDERSQHQNMEKALKLMRARLYDLKRREAHEAREALRAGQLGTGDRFERIRTYNYPQSRITDHRILSTKNGLEKMMRGEYLPDFIAELRHAEKLKMLAALGGESQT